MSHIFITGSSEGLGFHAGKFLLEQGHQVVLHARNEMKARAIKEKLPKCENVVVGDVSTVAAMKSVADQVNALGKFDAVIHNVALGTDERVITSDGVTRIFAVNTLAPYVLTALIHKPHRLVYVSSDMHSGGDESLDDLQWEKRRWEDWGPYSDTKLHNLILSMFVARRWPDVLVNALNPGWIPTKLGGSGAPGNFRDGTATQIWLAVSDDPEAKVSGHYFDNKRSRPFKRAAANPELQHKLITYLEQVSGIKIP
jgi:NAD(P)-dependent dehydrogenase (short-subunit alcohol dehydrogenase family)